MFFNIFFLKSQSSSVISNFGNSNILDHKSCLFSSGITKALYTLSSKYFIHCSENIIMLISWIVNLQIYGQREPLLLISVCWLESSDFWNFKLLQQFLQTLPNLHYIYIHNHKYSKAVFISIWVITHKLLTSRYLTHFFAKTTFRNIIIVGSVSGRDVHL